jgi:hypothetical protein
MTTTTTTTTTPHSSSSAATPSHFGFGKADQDLASIAKPMFYVGLANANARPILNLFDPSNNLHYAVQNVSGLNLAKAGFYYCKFDAMGGLVSAFRAKIPANLSLQERSNSEAFANGDGPLLTGGISGIALVREADAVRPIRTSSQRDTQLRETRLAFISEDGAHVQNMSVSFWGDVTQTKLESGQVLLVMNARQSKFHNVMRWNIGDSGAVADISETDAGIQFKEDVNALLRDEGVISLPEGLEPWTG